MKPNVFAFTQPQHHQRADDPPQPISMQSSPDLRWARRDIKTTNLLGQVLAKQVAREAGADEALMIDREGFVTEGGATSFFIVKGGVLHVRPLTNEILSGITRKTMLRVATEGVCPSTRADSRSRMFLTRMRPFRPVHPARWNPSGRWMAAGLATASRVDSP